MYSTFNDIQGEKVDNLQKEINSWKKGMGDKLFKKIFRGFQVLCKNSDEEKQSQLYITEGSLIKNMPKLFGYKNEFIAKRFYSMMTNRNLGFKVAFPDYMVGLSLLLLGDEYIQQ